MEKNEQHKLNKDEDQVKTVETNKPSTQLGIKKSEETAPLELVPAAQERNREQGNNAPQCSPQNEEGR